MSVKSVLVPLLLVLALGCIRPAHAQFAVIDVASLAQLLQEYETLQQQVATARSQLSQAQAEYAAMTGNRGMERLLSGTNRNYLPTSWTQFSQVMSGSSSGYPGLAGDVRALVSSNAVLPTLQVTRLSTTQQVQLASARESPAMAQAIARAGLSNSSDRFASLQQLIGAIGGAADAKAALDLSARIAAEQTMLTNEQTKLQLLNQVAQSQDAARTQQLREQALLDQGSLRQLPAMGL